MGYNKLPVIPQDGVSMCIIVVNALSSVFRIRSLIEMSDFFKHRLNSAESIEHGEILITLPHTHVDKRACHCKVIKKKIILFYLVFLLKIIIHWFMLY